MGRVGQDREGGGGGGDRDGEWDEDGEWGEGGGAIYGWGRGGVEGKV
jgi:hypothetical protein